MDIDYTYALKGMKVGDFVFSGTYRTLSRASNVYANENYGGKTSAILGLVADLGAMRKFETTTAIDADPGETVQASIPAGETSVMPAGCVLLNTSTGNLMRTTTEAAPASASAATPVTVEGLCNLFDVAAAFTASSPLSLSNGVLSIDLSEYAALAGATFTGAVSGIAPTANAHFATKQYVDEAVPAIQASSPLSFSNGTISIDLSSYATKQYVDNAVPLLSGYATESWVTQQINAAIAALDDLSEEEF